MAVQRALAGVARCCLLEVMECKPLTRRNYIAALNDFLSMLRQNVNDEDFRRASGFDISRRTKCPTRATQVDSGVFYGNTAGTLEVFILSWSWLALLDVNSSSSKLLIHGTVQYRNIDSPCPEIKDECHVLSSIMHRPHSPQARRSTKTLGVVVRHCQCHIARQVRCNHFSTAIIPACNTCLRSLRDSESRLIPVWPRGSHTNLTLIISQRVQ